MTPLQTYLLLYIVAINAIAWAMFGVDKYKARRNRWRVREGTLWTLALLGGSGGAWLGMMLFRHKTKHLRFVIGMPLMIVLNCIALAFLYKFLQRW